MKPARPNGVGAAATGVAFGPAEAFKLAPQCGHQGGMRPSELAKTCFEQLPQLVADAMISTTQGLIIGALANSSSRVTELPASEMAASVLILFIEAFGECLRCQSSELRASRIPENWQRASGGKKFR